MAGDGLVGPVVHLDEREAAAAAGLAVGDDLRAQHGPVLGERLHEVVAGGVERDVPDVQLLLMVFLLGLTARNTKQLRGTPARETGADELADRDRSTRNDRVGSSSASIPA